MIESMTGFGRGEARNSSSNITVEIKCVNHKYFDTHLKAPKMPPEIETLLGKYLKKHLRRGRADVYIYIKNIGEPRINISYDEVLAKKYLSVLEDLRKTLQISEPVSLDFFLKTHGILATESISENPETLWSTMEEALEPAVLSILEMRRKEGQIMADDVKERLNLIEKCLGEIQDAAKEIVSTYKDKLLKRLQEMRKDIVFEENRLMQEVIIYSDKTDISEELVRAKSHLKQFRENLCIKEPVGRKLDFLVQEFNREINTIGSKCSALAASGIVVNMKVELEKIREQIQNIV